MIERKGMFHLGWTDLIRGATTAVATAFVVMLGNIVLAAGFDLFAVEWTALLKSMANMGVITFFGYLMRNLVSDRDGRFLGVIG